MNKPVPIPPHGKLQTKKSTLGAAYSMLTELHQRIKQDAPVRHRLMELYKTLLDYPLGLYTNTLSHTEPMLYRADGLICDCLGVVRIGYINGVFIANDYDELSKQLTWARNIINEVYFIETQRPRPYKAGTRPNCGKASPETRAEAALLTQLDPIQTAHNFNNSGWSNLTSATDLSAPIDIRPLLNRQADVQAAFDELKTLEHTGLVEDVATLLGVLESYKPDIVTQQVEPLIRVADSYVMAAKGICWQIIRTNYLTSYSCQTISIFLENALFLIGCLL